jgi:hypothetical protein
MAGEKALGPDARLVNRLQSHIAPVISMLSSKDQIRVFRQSLLVRVADLCTYDGGVWGHRT